MMKCLKECYKRVYKKHLITEGHQCPSVHLIKHNVLINLIESTFNFIYNNVFAITHLFTFLNSKFIRYT
jgi:hypothetical protein